MRADVVQQCRELEPLALAIGQHVGAARLIEDRERQPRDLARVLGPVAAALGQLDDAAPPHVWILAGLRDVLPVALDVVEHQPSRSAKSQSVISVAPSRCRMVSSRTAPETMRSARRGSRPGSFMRSLMLRSIDLFAKTVNLLGRDAQVANFVAGAPALGGRDRAEAENRSGRANHAVESGALDVAQIFRQLVLDVPDELPFVASGQRVRVDEPLGQPDDPQFEASCDTKSVARAVGDFDAAAADVHHHR